MRTMIAGLVVLGTGVLWSATTFAIGTEDKEPELALSAISGTWGENNNCELDDGLIRIDPNYKDNFSKKKPFPALVLNEEICEIKLMKPAGDSLALSAVCKDSTEPPQKRSFKIGYLDRSHIRLDGRPYKRCPAQR